MSCNINPVICRVVSSEYLSFHLEPSNGFAVQIPHDIIAETCAVQSISQTAALTAAIARKKTASINAEEHGLRFFRLHLVGARNVWVTDDVRSRALRAVCLVAY
jgi:hypothetical protein